MSEVLEVVLGSRWTVLIGAMVIGLASWSTTSSVREYYQNFEDSHGPYTHRRGFDCSKVPNESKFYQNSRLNLYGCQTSFTSNTVVIESTGVEMTVLANGVVAAYRGDTLDGLYFSEKSSFNGGDLMEDPLFAWMLLEKVGVPPSTATVRTASGPCTALPLSRNDLSFECSIDDKKTTVRLITLPPSLEGSSVSFAGWLYGAGGTSDDPASRKLFSPRRVLPVANPRGEQTITGVSTDLLLKLSSSLPVKRITANNNDEKSVVISPTFGVPASSEASEIESDAHSGVSDDASAEHEEAIEEDASVVLMRRLTSSVISGELNKDQTPGNLVSVAGMRKFVHRHVSLVEGAAEPTKGFYTADELYSLYGFDPRGRAASLTTLPPWIGQNSFIAAWSFWPCMFSALIIGRVLAGWIGKKEGNVALFCQVAMLSGTWSVLRFAEALGMLWVRQASLFGDIDYAVPGGRHWDRSRPSVSSLSFDVANESREMFGIVVVIGILSVVGFIMVFTEVRGANCGTTDDLIRAHNLKWYGVEDRNAAALEEQQKKEYERKLRKRRGSIESLMLPGEERSSSTPLLPRLTQLLHPGGPAAEKLLRELEDETMMPAPKASTFRMRHSVVVPRFSFSAEEEEVLPPVPPRHTAIYAAPLLAPAFGEELEESDAEKSSVDAELLHPGDIPQPAAVPRITFALNSVPMDLPEAIDDEEDDENDALVGSSPSLNEGSAELAVEEVDAIEPFEAIAEVAEETVESPVTRDQIQEDDENLSGLGGKESEDFPLIGEADEEKGASPVKDTDSGDFS